MKKLYIAASVYLVLGLVAGLYYREATKNAQLGPEGAGQLSVVHTHVLTLGFLVLLVVLALDKLFDLAANPLFGWFFWVYNAGVVLSAGMMLWHGTLTVHGQQGTPMIAGIAGLGHITLSAGLVLLMLTLRPAVFASRPTR